MITFNQSGNLIKILHSLYFCKELSFLSKEKKCNLHIQNNINNEYIENDFFEKIKSLLKVQDYINDVTCDDILPQNAYNLLSIEDSFINTERGYLAEFYYNLSPHHLPREFWKPILKVEPNYNFKDKILLFINLKYKNPFLDFLFLKKYQDKLLFVTINENDYNFFCKKYFQIEKIKYNNFLELAQYIVGAKGFIGNQGEIFTISDCLKSNRILISPNLNVTKHDETRDEISLDNDLNVNQPYGGWYEIVSTTQKLKYSLINMLE